MNIGMIGLGRMGSAIAERLLHAGHAVFGYDRTPSPESKQRGITYCTSFVDMAQQARVIWLMVPIEAVDTVLDELVPHLKSGDIVVDGGNSFYEDSRHRAAALAKKGIIFLDCGTSGGLGGRVHGFCLMVGGDEAAYKKIKQLLDAIAVPNGVAHVGPSGAGHYVKMIHNGIEYGMLQAYAEGFQILRDGSFKKESLNLEQISGLWNTSSIIRSYLLGLAHEVFKEDQEFETISGEIAEGGTGKWTMQEAKKNTIPAPVLEQSLAVRSWSRESGGNYATKLIALVRNKFGGHAVGKKKKGNV